MADHVGEVLGAAGPLSTTERKIQAKQQRLAYGNQLQQQMAQQAEARKREKMERMGIPLAPSGAAGALHAPPSLLHAPRPYIAGVGSIPSYQPNPSSVPTAVPFPAVQPAVSGMAFGVQQYGGMPHQPQPAYDSSPLGPAALGMHGGGPMMPSSNSGSFSVFPGAGAGLPGPPDNFAPYSPRSYAAAVAGQPYNMPADNRAGPDMYARPLGGMHQRHQMPPMGVGDVMVAAAGAMQTGLGGWPSGGDKAAERARKDAYRLELEAQMRAKEERKRAEREASLHDARQRQAAMAQRDYAAAGMYAGGGGGAPLRNFAGHVPDLAAMQGFQQAKEQEQALGMMPLLQPAFEPPAQHLMRAGLGLGGGGGAALGLGGEQPAGPSSHSASPVDLNPNFRFRSDNAYLTKAELDNKARQKAELQEALERQIAEKRFKKEQEKAALQEEALREEQRLRSERDRLKAQHEQDRAREDGKDGATAEDKVAAAWARAKADSEEAKRSKFEGRRAAGRKSQEGLGNLHDSLPGLPEQASSPAFEPAYGAVHLQPVQQLVMAAPSTPLVAEKVKQLAAQELSKVRAELQAEADSLRSMVAEQTAQVAALKQHAERMETRAEQAQAHVSQMRVDLIRSSLAAPESFMRMMADYPMQPQAAPPPNMLDIALDLPPPAALQRRALQSQPVYDMGPLIPCVHNPSEADPQAARNFLVTPGNTQRPPTQGMRSINPLEASLAAESVLIYPSGRALQHVLSTRQDQRMMTAASPAASDLALHSAALSPGAFAGPVLLQHATEGTVFSHRQPAGNTQGGRPCDDESPVSAPLQHSSVMLSPNRAAAALAGLTSEEDCTTTVQRMQGEVLNPALAPPATADAIQKLQAHLQEEAAAAAAAAATARTPMDVHALMQQNKDKLNLLQELTSVTATDSVEAIDAFLTKFSKAHPGLPERTHTPLLRINTPMASGYGASTASIPDATVATASCMHGSAMRDGSTAAGPMQLQAPLAGTSRQPEPLVPAPSPTRNLNKPRCLSKQPSSTMCTPPHSPIIFTDNNTSVPPAATGRSRPVSSASSQYATGHSEAVGGHSIGMLVLSGDNLPSIIRPASHGRRAGSADSQSRCDVPCSEATASMHQRPPLPQGHTTATVGDDTLDIEMRKGLGSRPPSGLKKQPCQLQVACSNGASTASQ